MKFFVTPLIYLAAGFLFGVGSVTTYLRYSSGEVRNKATAEYTELRAELNEAYVENDELQFQLNASRRILNELREKAAAGTDDVTTYNEILGSGTGELIADESKEPESLSDENPETEDDQEGGE